MNVSKAEEAVLKSCLLHNFLSVGNEYTLLGFYMEGDCLRCNSLDLLL